MSGRSASVRIHGCRRRRGSLLDKLLRSQGTRALSRARCHAARLPGHAASPERIFRLVSAVAVSPGRGRVVVRGRGLVPGGACGTVVDGRAKVDLGNVEVVIDIVDLDLLLSANCLQDAGPWSFDGFAGVGRSSAGVVRAGR